MSFFRRIRQAIRTLRQSKIQKIPPEIVQLILELLSTQDQICFALSCRYIFACLDEYLKAHKQGIRQLVPPEKRAPFCPNVNQRPIIQLLLRLEDKRWKFCSLCWKLHLRSDKGIHLNEYYRSRLYLDRFSFRICSNDLLLAPFATLYPTLCPTLHPSEVYLCPCLRITFSDKLKLMETCDSVQKNTQPGSRYYYNKVFYRGSYDNQIKFLRHKCAFTSHPFAKVGIDTTIWTNEETHSLVVHNQYWFKIHQRPEGDVIYPPKENRGRWLRKFFSDAGSGYVPCPKPYWPPSFSIGVEPPPRRFTLPVPSFSMSVTRKLGKAQWTDLNWDLVANDPR